MTALENVRGTTSLSEFAALIGYKASSLAYVLYKIPSNEKYSTFEIEKSLGGVRKIATPIDPLKDIQRRLANILYACRREWESQSSWRPLSHGFRLGHSIFTNANCHKRRRYVLNLDIEDFFPSFNFGRVRGFFLKNRHFEANEKVATIIAQIACHENSLPQGSPCSPIISDLIAHILDIQLVQLAKRCTTTYSRYADDITFSTNQRVFPSCLAEENSNNPGQWDLSTDLIEAIEKSGFRVNNAKTRMQTRKTRQTVTGLTVNAKVNIRADYYRTVRAMCHSLFHTGSYYSRRHVVRAGNGTKETTAPAPTETLRPLEGMLSHIHYIKHLADDRTEAKKKAHPTSAHHLYQRFLRFSQFVMLETPLVICEGKTDSIYLRSAIRSLAHKHPNLGMQTKSGFNQRISFFNYDRQVSKILNLKGGTGDLKFLIEDYKRNLTKFSYRPLKHPVILLIDNDDGAKPIFGLLKGKYGISLNIRSAKPHFHITENLYLVKTPSIKGGGKTCIEDFFDDATRNTKVDGKSFNPNKKIDSHAEYGKLVFAEKVVRPNASKIDFSGFSRILERLESVIDAYVPPDSK